MTFEYGSHVFNLLDTPGHEKDFSRRTPLSHAHRRRRRRDGSTRAAKGVEAQTLKLVEVCRLRIPIVTFINKMDRGRWIRSKLLDDIENSLALDTRRSAGRSGAARP